MVELEVFAVTLDVSRKIETVTFKNYIHIKFVDGTLFNDVKIYRLTVWLKDR